MENNAELIFLTRYKAWADNILYDALSEIPLEQLTTKRPMLFGSILRLLNHVYTMDIAWKHNLEKAPHQLKTRSPELTPNFTDLRSLQSEINQWYKEYANGLSMKQSQDEITFTFIGGEQSSMRQCNVIQHIVNHATYHRGHVEGALYQIPVDPRTTDIPVFIREMGTSRG